jgi:hypothetical protein
MIKDLNRPNIVTQPQMGRPTENYKPGDKMGSYIALARIIKIHHKHHTADVQLVKTNNVVSSTAENEGKYGARIGVVTAHFNEKTLTSSGVIEPMQEGQLVVLAFMDENSKQPIILCSFHSTWSTKQNILVDKYPLNPRTEMQDYCEAYKYLRVFPSQGYTKVDGNGGIELSLPSTTFLKIDNEINLPDGAKLSDGREDFDHDDLSEKDPYRGFQTIKGQKEQELLPVNMLLVHRSHYDPSLSTWTKFFMNKNGSFRWTRDSHEDNLTYMEVGDKGAVTLRRQQDSHIHGESEDYTESRLSELGEYSVSKKKGNKCSTIAIDDNGDIKLSISFDDGLTSSFVKLSDNGDITFNAKGNIILGGVSILYDDNKI